jgi:hypothetical protein
MLYGHIEDSSQRGESYHPIYPADLRRNTADMLPPSLRHSGSSSIVSITEGPASTYAGAAPVTVPQQGIAFAWQHTIPSQSPKSMEFSGWYSDQGQLANVQEEQEVPPHFVPDHGLVYSNGGHQ